MRRQGVVASPRGPGPRVEASRTARRTARSLSSRGSPAALSDALSLAQGLASSILPSVYHARWRSPIPAPSTSVRNLLLAFVTRVLHCAACDASRTPHPRRDTSGERSPHHPHPERTEDHVSTSSGDANRQEGHDAHQRALALVRLRSLASFLHPSARCGGALRPSRRSARPGAAARQAPVDAFPRTAYNQENRDPWPPMARPSRRRSGAARR